MRHIKELQIEIKLNISNFINKNLLIHTSAIIRTIFFRKPANQGKDKKAEPQNVVKTDQEHISILTAWVSA
jgi:hypothetical protein